MFCRTCWSKSSRNTKNYNPIITNNLFNRCFSNFYRHKPIKFTIPEWCGACAGKIVYIDFTEKAIMLCKASLMWDKESFNTILKADTPTKVKRLGRKVKEFNEEEYKFLALFRLIYKYNDYLKKHIFLF